MPVPNIPRPTTVIPITEPPENAISKALPIPDCIAAFVVLTLAFVATVIPKYPASAEHEAPAANAIAVGQLIANPKIKNITIAKILTDLYSLARNAIAPSWIYEDISCILSLPGSALLTIDAL